MKKVAIVTLYHNNHNFGGQLQAYALQHVVASYGYICDIVDYNPQNKYKKLKTLTVGTLLVRFYHKTQMKIHQWVNPQMKTDFRKKADLFRQFMNSIPHTEEITNDRISAITSDYDCWIAGSDQIWNPEAFTGGSLYLLEGVLGKKVSYAASSMNAKFTLAQAHVLRKSLDSFSDISVREEGLEKTISEISGKPVTTVLDPTLLLGAGDWDKVTVQPQMTEKYAFVYVIGVSTDVRRRISDYCKKNRFQMVIVPHAQGWYKAADERYFDVQAAAIGPAEWLGYIKNAEIIFTDSFHGTIFSVNYHKKFVSFENLSGDAEKDSGLRKYSILRRLGLADRCVPYSYDLNSEILAEDIDYASVDQRLQELRKHSESYLAKALGLAEDKD
ncbi:MAG: polysaccharide pyruvyl transferase family protein [Clostridia bacterium]|nr:polysaccharide pyruvyl transferase family protein [Clostridia bacterium]